jgi:hypothetical protein
VDNITVGGVIVLPLLVFLVQTAREAFDIEVKFVPLVAIALAVAMMLFAEFAPYSASRAVFIGLGLGAAASASVRYVKEGKQNKTARKDVIIRGS